MATWGYARVSTLEQDPAPQVAALTAAGVDADHLRVDHVSGATQARPGLDEVLAALAAGDVLVVWKLDRLGRSVAHLARLVADLGDRGVEFRSLTDGIDTRTPAGRFTFHLMAAVAELERELNRERTLAALAARRADGVKLGRRSKVTPGQYRLIMQGAAKGLSDEQIRESVGLSRAVIGRVRRGEIPSIAHYADLPAEPVELTLAMDENPRGHRTRRGPSRA